MVYVPCKTSVNDCFTHYHYDNSYNRFEILKENDDDADAMPAPLQVIVNSDPLLCAEAEHSRSNANLQQYSPPLNTDVESMTVEELTAYIEHYSLSFVATDDPVDIVSQIQAQPSSLAPLLDAHTPNNLGLLMDKAPGHAVQRLIQMCDERPFVIAAKKEQSQATNPQALWMHIWPHQVDATFPFNEILKELVKQDFIPLIKTLARFDLFLQINQPDIYFNPLKVSSIVKHAYEDTNIAAAIATIPKAPHYLWSDATIIALASSKLGNYLAECKNLDNSIKQDIQLLAHLHPLTTTTLHCYYA